MTLRSPIGFALLLTLGACAGDPGRYPSLAIRDIERVYGSAQPVAPAPEPRPVAPSPELGQNLASLQQQASEAHTAFMAAAPEAQSLVAAAHDAEIASDGWVAAQTGLADLEASRNKVMLAMADLDRLLIAAELEGGARDAIAQAQASVELLVRQEDDVLEGLITQLQSQPGM